MVEMPTIGKRVRMVAGGPAGSTSHEGVVLPGAAQNHITVKLVNGYNVSYPIEMVESIDEISDVESHTDQIGSVEQKQISTESAGTGKLQNTTFSIRHLSEAFTRVLLSICNLRNASQRLLIWIQRFHDVSQRPRGAANRVLSDTRSESSSEAVARKAEHVTAYSKA